MICICECVHACTCVLVLHFFPTDTIIKHKFKSIGLVADWYNTLRVNIDNCNTLLSHKDPSTTQIFLKYKIGFFLIIILNLMHSI
jgi:hypothetical protein